jgi:hypothetical protein
MAAALLSLLALVAQAPMGPVRITTTEGPARGRGLGALAQITRCVERVHTSKLSAAPCVQWET